MMRLALALALLAPPALAETLIAARTIRAQTIIAPEDLAWHDGALPGGIDDPALLVGMEARVALYAGRAVRVQDVSSPAIVDRNGIITLVFAGGGLTIATEGRALGRAAPGDVIRVMNLSSRNIVSARIGQDGAAYVGGPLR